MYAYDAGPSRRSRDVPPISSHRYRDTGLYDYAPPVRSRSSRHPDPEPAAPAPHDRHRRKSFSHGPGDEGRPSRRAAVVASDDGRGSRDAYGSYYPERTSRHDIEAKNSDGSREFRRRRERYEADEAEKLRRAKSYSPRRAAQHEDGAPRKHSPQGPPKSNWAGDDGGYGSDSYRSSAKPARAPQQYYGDDAYAGRGGKPRESAMDGKDYGYGPGAGSSSGPLPRPPAGDYIATGGGQPDEKSPKSSRESKARDTKPPVYDNPYPDYDAYEPPRRHHRSSRVPEDKPSKGHAFNDDYGYPPAPPPPAPAPAPARGRDRPPPPPMARDYNSNNRDDMDDPYDRPPPRSRQRQSVPPPHARSRYPDYDDHYDAPPPRRAASAHHRQNSRHSPDDGPGRQAGYPEDRPSGGRPRSHTAGGGAAQNSHREKQKKWGKQAGKLFMTHAVPVIKQEAVPLLTKAAKAYMDNKAR